MGSWTPAQRDELGPLAPRVWQRRLGRHRLAQERQRLVHRGPFRIVDGRPPADLGPEDHERTGQLVPGVHDVEPPRPDVGGHRCILAGTGEPRVVARAQRGGDRALRGEAGPGAEADLHVAQAATSLRDGPSHVPAQARDVVALGDRAVGQRHSRADPRRRRPGRERLFPREPRDLERVAEPVQDAAGERVIAGPGSRRDRGDGDPALVVRADHHRVGSRVQVEAELGARLLGRRRRRAHHRAVFGLDPGPRIGEQLLGCRRARDPAAFRRLPLDLDHDCQRAPSDLAPCTPERYRTRGGRGTPRWYRAPASDGPGVATSAAAAPVRR